jgi:hypothetical protein
LAVERDAFAGEMCMLRMSQKRIQQRGHRVHIVAAGLQRDDVWRPPHSDRKTARQVELRERGGRAASYLVMLLLRPIGCTNRCTMPLLSFGRKLMNSRSDSSLKYLQRRVRKAREFFDG